MNIKVRHADGRIETVKQVDLIAVDFTPEGGETILIRKGHQPRRFSKLLSFWTADTLE